jgi:hypothetical protein
VNSSAAMGTQIATLDNIRVLGSKSESVECNLQLISVQSCLATSLNGTGETCVVHLDAIPSFKNYDKINISPEK